MAVVQRQGDLQEDIPNLVFVERLTAPLCLPDQRSEVTRGAILSTTCQRYPIGYPADRYDTYLHDNEDLLLLRITNLLDKLDNVPVFERFENGPGTSSQLVSDLLHQGERTLLLPSAPCPSLSSSSSRVP